MKERGKNRTISTLAPLVVFVIFTACILMVLLTGAGIYKKLLQRDQDSYSRRTAVQYLTMRVHQNDVRGGIFVGDFHEGLPKASGDTLFLREELEGQVYYTRIYGCGGHLCELFAEAGGNFLPEDGEQILEADGLEFFMEKNQIRVRLTDSKGVRSIFVLTLRSGGEEGA